MKSPCCPNPECSHGNVVRYGYYKTKSGKRRRYRCTTCRKTFCSTRGTPYYRLQHRRSTFDEVAALSVERVMREVFGPACLYAQVIKTRRNDRVVKVERKSVIGAKWRFEEALSESEDSSTLNTSFIERLNLTIRQGSAYLSRRTICHARSRQRLDDHLETLRCHYNFSRPHRALKFGPEMRTPAMQAGLARRRLTFRDIFSLRAVRSAPGRIVYVFADLTAGRCQAA